MSDEYPGSRLAAPLPSLRLKTKEPDSAKHVHEKAIAYVREYY